jgi:hypothetical protein
MSHVRQGTQAEWQNLDQTEAYTNFSLDLEVGGIYFCFNLFD